MNGPSDDLRAQVFARLEAPRTAGYATDADAEGALNETLDMLERAIADDAEASDILRDVALGELGEEEAWELLASVQAWAGLASAAVAQVYAPASPWPRSIAGWGTKAIARLQGVVRALLAPLRAAANAIGATPSISVGFPWGLSVGLNW